MVLRKQSLECEAVGSLMAEIEPFKRGMRLKSLDEFDQQPFKVLTTGAKPTSSLLLVSAGLLIGGLLGLVVSII
jgi:hypothetical protein